MVDNESSESKALSLETFRSQYETPVIEAVKLFRQQAELLSPEDRERALDRLALGIDGLCAAICGKTYSPVTASAEYDACIDSCFDESR